jgi:hypothetical protein
LYNGGDMPRYVAHFDETDHMEGKLLGFGGTFTTGGRLDGLGETWQEMRSALDMPDDREIRWSNLNWDKRSHLAAWVSTMPIWIVVDLLIDHRGISDRTARDHYRVGLRWAIGKVARVARGGTHSGHHQIIVDRVPGIRRLSPEHRDDPRLEWASGRAQTYAHIEYDDLYWNGNGPMRVPRLRGQSFYPSLLESDATYNCFLELADMTLGTFARWAAGTFDQVPDDRLDDMVYLMAPKLVLPNGELGFDIFCPNGKRSPYWIERGRLIRSVGNWAKG